MTKDQLDRIRQRDAKGYSERQWSSSRVVTEDSPAQMASDRHALLEHIDRLAVQQTSTRTGPCYECGNAAAPLNADGSIGPHTRSTGEKGFMVDRPCRGSAQPTGDL